MQKKGGIYRLPLTYTILTYAADPEQLSYNKRCCPNEHCFVWKLSK